MKKFLKEMASFQARRLWWQGKIDLARRELRGDKITAEQGREASMEISALTLARVLIAYNQESSWREAEELLQDLWICVEQAQPGTAKPCPTM